MYEQDTYMNQSQAPQDPRQFAPVSTGAFFGYKLLYGIPVVGWILCLVFSFTEKNVNKRNFARATLIGLIISLVITCVIGFAVVKVAQVVIEQVMMETLGDSFGEMGVMKDVLDELQDGKYDDLIRRIEDGEFGDHPELSGMLDELRDNGMLAVMNQMENGRFEDVMENFAMGEYDDLVQKIVDGELGDLGALGDLLTSMVGGDVSGFPGNLVQ